MVLFHTNNGLNKPKRRNSTLTRIDPGGRLGFAFLKEFVDYSGIFFRAFKNDLNYKLWSGGAFVEAECATRVARVCARNGPSMNLLLNSIFFRRDTTTKKGDSGNVLFSGFLAAFLGATGIQAGLPAHFDTFKNSELEEVKAGQVFVACQEQIGVKAIIEDSSLSSVAPDTQDAKEPVKECEQKEKIEATVEAEVTISELQSGESALTQAEQKEEELYKKRVASLEELLEGYPLEKMAPEIAKQDPEIAALIVGIARKESQWGVRSPKKNGDCYNYWGFKGAGGRGVGMGHACFATREEAVEKIANRLEKLVDKRGTSKPSAMVVTWKCGSSCAGHSKESVNKWVSDVNQYYTKVLAMK